MCGRAQSGQDAGLSEEQAAGAYGQQCALLFRILLLQVAEGADEAERLGFRLKDGIDAAAGDDQDVKFGEARVGFLEVHVGAEAGALGRNGVFGEGDEGCGEGFGGWRRDMGKLCLR